MSWTYSGNPKDSELDEFRFILGDTDPNEPILTDEEINFIIYTSDGDRTRILYELFNRAAILFARQIKRSLGPQSEDPTSRADFFKSKAASYKLKLANSGLSLPIYAHPKIFRKGMQNNPPWPRPRGDDYRV